MEQNKQRNRNVAIIMAIVFTSGLLVGTGAGFKIAAKLLKQDQATDTATFYDGEGNTIPTAAVRALVKDQYVHLTPQERALSRQYFPDSNVGVYTGFIYVREPKQDSASEVIAYPQDSFTICRKVN